MVAQEKKRGEEVRALTLEEGKYISKRPQTKGKKELKKDWGLVTKNLFPARQAE